MGRETDDKYGLLGPMPEFGLFDRIPWLGCVINESFEEPGRIVWDIMGLVGRAGVRISGLVGRVVDEIGWLEVYFTPDSANGGL